MDLEKNLRELIQHEINKAITMTLHGRINRMVKEAIALELSARVDIQRAENEVTTKKGTPWSHVDGLCLESEFDQFLTHYACANGRSKRAIAWKINHMHLVYKAME
uniref:Uncharacterized protein n=1 Tax=viral metagenome TaxID=1070528 RepID=A0A6M3IH60_9ZZZZ